ncbi:ATP-binding cassette domain-containing protein [Streptomyces sp. NPDC102451]|uniref:ATP-binding cassette domain-containing protein n=1 Tax=Streptomyces sp. NPDC102451 TaxID=3366177 RepID=UPI00381F378D
MSVMSTSLKPAAITTAGLTKSYGDKPVLKGLDLTIAEGSVYALLGPNGAGKTTTVEILATLIDGDGGTATVGGHDVAGDGAGVRSLIGLTGQFAAVDGLLSAEENLRLMADLCHLPKAEGRRRAARLLERFELTEAAEKPSSTYSGGMRRKLDLAMSLMGDPRIIFLDEPTTGLDPRSRRTMWEIIRALVADEGVTIFLTTQYLEEADQLADRIGVLHEGRLVAEGTSDELKAMIHGGHISLRFDSAAELERAAAQFTSTTRDDEELTLQIPSDGTVPTLRAVLDILDAADAAPASLSLHTPDLDDVFLALTGADKKQEFAR